MCLRSILLRCVRSVLLFPQDCSISTGAVSALVTVVLQMDVGLFSPTQTAPQVVTAPTITLSRIQPCADTQTDCSLGCNGLADALWFVNGYRATYTTTLQNNAVSAFQGLPALRIWSDVVNAAVAKFQTVVFPGASFGNACNTSAITWTNNAVSLPLASVQTTVVSPSRLQVAFDISTQVKYGLKVHACGEVDGGSCPTCTVRRTR